jgi:uncharacterized repeat protein (TIGR01451 family)
MLGGITVSGDVTVTTSSVSSTWFTVRFTNNGTGNTDFEITYQATSPLWWDSEVCNDAVMTAWSEEPTFSENADNGNTGEPDTPVCVWGVGSGYDLTITKSVLTDTTYGTDYTPEFNVYPENINSGFFYEGDWWVYRLAVSNIDGGDAYNVVVTDTLPAGLLIVDYEPSHNGVSISPAMPNGTSLTWTVDEVP